MSNLTINDARIQVRDQILRARSLIEPLLPKHVDFEQTAGRMYAHLQENPKLLECSPASIFWAFVHAAEVGLQVGNFLGEAYIIGYANKRNPQWKKATFVPGYKGLLKLAYQSQLISRVDAWLVYERDTIDIDYGRRPDPIHHRPYLGFEGPGLVIGVHTQIELIAGATKFNFMTLYDLERIRERSPGSSDPNHAWNTDRGEMQRKTGLRRALKDAPKSNEIDRALNLAEAEDTDEANDDSPELPTSSSIMSSSVVQSRQEPPPAPSQGRAAKSRTRLEERARELPAPQQPALSQQAINAPAQPVAVEAKPTPAQPPAPAPAQQVAPPMQPIDDEPDALDDGSLFS